MDKIKVNVKGAYGATNFGDDLLMDLFEKYFMDKFSNIEINFQGEHDVEYPNVILEKSSYNKDNFKENWLIYGGGTQFFSFQSSKRSLFSLLKTALFNPNKVLDKLFKKKVKVVEDIFKPDFTAFLGFGLGPFYDNVHKIKQVKDTLGKADFVGVRDNVSNNYCKEWSIEASFGADIAFSSFFSYDIKDKNVISTNEKKKIGIIVRDWVWEDTGRGFYSPIMELYKKKNDAYEYEFIVFAPFKDPDWLDILKDEEFLCWDPSKYSIESFLSVLNSFDGFISSRFHGAIVGALLGKPVINIEIEPKLRILSEDVKEIVLWEKPFELLRLEEMLDNLDYNVNYTESLNNLKHRSDKGLNDFVEKFNDLN